MANNFESNFTRKLMERVLDRFEANRVLSKNVNTQMFAGKWNPSTGTQIDVQRPTDYTSIRTPTGDISGQQRDIITGKATATVQDYITVPVDYDEADEALTMGNNKNRFYDDIANRIVIDLETDFARFVRDNAALRVGTPGTGVTSFSEVAEAGALMQSSGVPMNKRWCYAVNPYSQVALATEQRGLGVNPQAGDANATANIRENFAGFDVKTATTMQTLLTGSGADRAGALNGAPNATYLAAKDSMQQTLSVDGFASNLQIKAGETLTIAGINRLNLSTRDVAVDASGTPVPFTATVAEDVTLSGTGAGDIVISGPAIFEAGGAYNTVDSAPADNAVVTLGGTQNTVLQPNLFWHPDAFTISFVTLKKLYATDTVVKTRDGLVMRCTMDADAQTNRQTVRFDLLPAYGCMNPFFAGHGYGNP